MYNIYYSYGVAKVHLVNSPLPECQPQAADLKFGWWQTDLSRPLPDGAVIGAQGDKTFHVQYCEQCMQSQQG